MLSGKEFWQSLACFVTGGIITVILIKMLERKRDGNNEEQGGRQILIPVQEAGDGEREVERLYRPLQPTLESFHKSKMNFKVLLRTVIIFYFIIIFFLKTLLRR